MATQKPGKPYPDFPLFAHATGQWAKKIRGKLRYFGVWSNPEGALQRYLEERDDWYAGRVPAQGDSLTVGVMANQFLTAKRHMVDSGDLSERTWREYYTCCELLVKTFGRGAKLLSLTPNDFAALRSSMAKRLGPVALTNHVARVKTVLRYAEAARLIDRPVNVGPDFRGASAKVRRALRNQSAAKLFTAEQIRTVINSATVPMQAAILLGINCGFGNTDVAQLPLSAVDLDAGWIRFPRPKTSVMRECPLWPETVTALRAAIEWRRPDRTDETAGLVFVTTQGRPYVHYHPGSGGCTDALAFAFYRLLARNGLKRDGLSFYALRHTFQTEAENCGDPVAVRAIMGHANDLRDMSSTYRERINPDRLIKASDTVREWLEWYKMLPIVTTRKKI